MTTRRETLERLHLELEAALANNNTTQARIDSLKAQIRRMLDETEEEDESLVEQMQESAAELEAEHPTLAAAITTAINILSNAGL